MRPILAVLALIALALAGSAQAGVRMHLPHKRHHTHGEGRTTTDAPTSDIPEPVWTRPRN